MKALHHTYTSPRPELGGAQFVVDLGMSQDEYLDQLQQDVYALLTDIPNWSEVFTVPKPAFPLTGKTIGALPFVHIRYIATRLLNDALEDLMEARSPN